jgi:hypothetical protein
MLALKPDVGSSSGRVQNPAARRPQVIQKNELSVLNTTIYKSRKTGKVKTNELKGKAVGQAKKVFNNFNVATHSFPFCDPDVPNGQLHGGAGGNRALLFPRMGDRSIFSIRMKICFNFTGLKFAFPFIIT